MQVEAEHPVRITHPDKRLWPEVGITKLDYLEYLAVMAPFMLPHLRDRAVTVIRYPDGIHGSHFYQKDAPSGTPAWVTLHREWSTERRDWIHYVVIDSVSTLLWLGNLAALEFHIGFSPVHSPDRPTIIAFDLDPSVPGFEPVREVALLLHEVLTKLEIPAVAKTSGATGLQVLIPVTPDLTYDETRHFTKAIADYLLARCPQWVTLERLKRNRGRKVYVDYPQHGRHRTLIAPYSTRATPTATVSAPVTWQELERGMKPEDFTIRNVPARVRNMGDLLQQTPATDLRTVIRFLERHRPVRV